jgi:hypothetical protein
VHFLPPSLRQKKGQGLASTAPSLEFLIRPSLAFCQMALLIVAMVWSHQTKV